MRLLLCCAGLLSACATSSPQVATLTPPVDSACLASIRSYVQQETGRDVVLGTDIFRDSAQLVLEPSTALKLNGRVLSKPATFELYAKDQQCLIRNTAGDGKAALVALPQCQCKTP